MTQPLPRCPPLQKFLFEDHSWDKCIKADMRAVFAHLKEAGVTDFGVVGFCWGAAMAFMAAADRICKPDIRAAGGFHPTFIGTS